MSERPLLVCILGQTASGKSALALAIAERLGLEILSVDSMQVYRGFDIGTAKPSPEQQARVRHHGIDLAEPSETYSAGAFLGYAREVLTSASSSGKQVLAVGGTGLYLRAMLHGMAPSAPADPAFRARLRAQEAAAPGDAYGRLLAVDSTAAARIHANDFVRIERALEVFETTGQTQSQWVEEHGWGEAPFRTTLLGIAWERQLLRRRIAERVDAMLAAGWVEEVRSLLATGVEESMTPMMALGYRQIAQHLRGDLDLDSLRELVSTAIWRFAKRQGTWFNREPSIRWMEPGEDLVDRALPLVRDALSSGGPSGPRED